MHWLNRLSSPLQILYSAWPAPTYLLLSRNEALSINQWDGIEGVMADCPPGVQPPANQTQCNITGGDILSKLNFEKVASCILSRVLCVTCTSCRTTSASTWWCWPSWLSPSGSWPTWHSCPRHIGRNKIGLWRTFQEINWWKTVFKIAYKIYFKIWAYGGFHLG